MVAPTPGAVGTQRTGSTTTPAFAAPAGVGAGKVVVLAFFLDAATTITAMPDASWFHAPGSPLYVNVNSHSLNVLWARNPAGATYTVTVSGNAYSEGGAVRYDNCVASGSPWDTNSGIGAAVATDATSGTVTPAVSMTTQGADQCNVHAATDWGGGSWTPQAGYTKELGANVGLVTLSDKGQAVAGATGAVSATSTVADKRGAWLGSLLPLAGGTAVDIPDVPVIGAAARSSGGVAAIGVLAAQDPSGLVTVRSADGLGVGTGILVSDIPGIVRLGRGVETVAFGVGIPDSSIGIRLGSPLEAVLTGLVVLDTPGGFRVGSGQSSVLTGGLTGVTVLDSPGWARVGSPGGVVVIDQPTNLVPILAPVRRITALSEVGGGVILAPVKEVRA